MPRTKSPANRKHKTHDKGHIFQQKWDKECFNSQIQSKIV